MVNDQCQSGKRSIMINFGDHISLIMLPLLAVLVGCTPTVVDTPGGPVTCYSSNCIKLANEISSTYYRQVDLEQKKALWAEKEKKKAEERKKRIVAMEKWEREHPTEAAMERQSMIKYMNTLNAYGCPGTTIPKGPPWFGCGYRVTNEEYYRFPYRY